MLRTGIYNIQKLIACGPNDLFGKEKNISIKLYHDLINSNSFSNQEYDRYSEIILNRFNTRSNAIKRTYRNRFDQFDLKAIDKIKSLNREAIKIHDLAISDGRASCFFIEQLHKKIQKIHYTGSDIAMSYNCYFMPDDKKSYIITTDKSEIIEITRPPFVFNYARREGKFYFLNNLLKFITKKKFQKKINDNNFVKTEIKIADKVFLNALNNLDNFELINYNMFNASPSTFDIVRVMNILHFGYFDVTQILLILSNIYQSLEANGLFIEGSNEDAGSPVEGAIYQKTPNGFIVLESGAIKSRISECIEKFNRNFQP